MSDLAMLRCGQLKLVYELADVSGIRTNQNDVTTFLHKKQIENRMRCDSFG
jgi:hypothetical protein